MFSLYDLLFNLYIEIATVAFGYASQFLEFLVFGLEGLFKNHNVLVYETFLTVLAEALLVCGIGFAVSNWAISFNEGNTENIFSTIKNCFLGLFTSLGFIVIPVNLLRFTAECCQLLIQGMALDTISDQLNDKINSDTTVLGIIIFPLFSIIVLICMIKIFLSNIKRGGVLLILISICPLHIFSIPRGHTDGLFSWCKQVLALCLTTFVQNFLVALGFLILASTTELSLINVVMAMGVILASTEAPRFMERFGMETSLNINLTGPMYAMRQAASLVAV